MTLETGDILGLAVGIVIADKLINSNNKILNNKKKKKSKENSIWRDW